MVVGGGGYVCQIEIKLGGIPKLKLNCDFLQIEIKLGCWQIDWLLYQFSNLRIWY